MTNRKKPLLLLALAIAAILGFQVAAASLNRAEAKEPSGAAVAQSSDGAALMSHADDKVASKIEINPATDQAVACAGCVSAGSGCSGACPNAPGPRRQCRNVAAPGKPKICSCTTNY